MHIKQDDFINYMAFQDFVLEGKIEKCLSAARNGAHSISIDRANLSDADIQYIQKEVQRRIKNGDV